MRTLKALNIVCDMYIRHNSYYYCAAGFALLNLPKGKSLGRSKPETNSYAQALATHCVGFLLYPSSSELPLMRNKISTTNVSELGYLFHDKSSLHNSLRSSSCEITIYSS